MVKSVRGVQHVCTALPCALAPTLSAVCRSAGCGALVSQPVSSSFQYGGPFNASVPLAAQDVTCTCSNSHVKECRWTAPQAGGVVDHVKDAILTCGRIRAPVSAGRASIHVTSPNLAASIESNVTIPPARPWFETPELLVGYAVTPATAAAMDGSPAAAATVGWDAVQAASVLNVTWEDTGPPLGSPNSSVVGVNAYLVRADKLSTAYGNSAWSVSPCL